jgi:hypothetical protein
MTAGELQQLIFDPQQQAFVDPQQQQAFADQQQHQAFADQLQQQHPQEAYPDRRYVDDHRRYTDQMQFDPHPEDRDRSYRLPGRLLGDQQAARLAGNLASPPWRSRKLEEGGGGVDSNDLQSSLDQSQHRVSMVSFSLVCHYCPISFSSVPKLFLGLYPYLVSCSLQKH